MDLHGSVPHLTLRLTTHCFHGLRCLACQLLLLCSLIWNEQQALMKKQFLLVHKGKCLALWRPSQRRHMYKSKIRANCFLGSSTKSSGNQTSEHGLLQYHNYSLRTSLQSNTKITQTRADQGSYCCSAEAGLEVTTVDPREAVWVPGREHV